MLLALSEKISQIDSFCENTLGISTVTLMERSGNAVADALRREVKAGSSVVILAGKGNNGGDGYAAACSLYGDYSVTVVDVFGKGQKNECGRYFHEKYREIGGRVEIFENCDSIVSLIRDSQCLIDAVFGTGYRGEVPDEVRALSRIVNESTRPVKIAIDVPMGINADNGSVDSDTAVAVNTTVALSFIKPGLVSFPAKAYVGKLVFDNLSLPLEPIISNFSFDYYYVDEDLAKSLLPARPQNSSKGTFGRALLVTGSDRYRGAAALSLEAALRGGAGYVSFVGTADLCKELRLKYPEALYNAVPSLSQLTDEEINVICNLSHRHTVTLVGSGSSVCDGLYTLVCQLLESEGAPIVLDADAINVMAEHRNDALERLSRSERTVILTPHPLELSRLMGIDVSHLQLHRIELAKRFAGERGVILVLKGAATVVTDGASVYINSTGSSALAKAGSGDVLSGLLCSLAAFMQNPLHASALAVYLHGRASDTLSRELSEFGVIPSELPRQIAAEIASLLKL